MRKSDGTNRKPKEGEEKNYKTIFKEAPISLWEVDFSGIQGYLDMIKEKEGIEDFREYFQLFPGAINKIVNLVEIVNVNKAAIKLIKAKSKKELKRNIRNVFTDKARKDFIKGLIAINKGETRYAEETTLKTLKEKNIHVMMRIIAIPDDEKTLSNVLIAITDITELKRAEEEISQILEGSPIPAFVIDSEHILTHWNKACEKLTGKSTRDLIGTKDEWSAFYPKERPVMAELIVDGTLECEIREIYGKSCRKSYLEGAYEAEGIFPKLGNKWLSFTAAPLKDAKGNIIGAIETLQDITDRINTQEALKEEYNLLNSLMEHIPDSIYFKDTAGHFTRINKAKAERMKLADPSEAIGKTDYDFYDKEHADRASADEKEIIKSRVPLINKEEKLRINGEIFRWVSATKVPIINRKGEVTGIVGISRDITESKRVKEKISQIVQGNSIATFVIDNKHILTHWNIACEKLTGISADEMVGTKDPWRAFYPTKRPVMADIIVDGASEKKMVKYYGERYWKSKLIKGAYEGEGIFPKLGNKWLSFTATPLKDDKGKIIGAIETLQDITEHKRRERARELSQIVQGNPIPTFVIDSEHKVTHWNKAMEELTGVVADEMVETKKPWSVFYPKKRPVMADLMVDEVSEKVVAKYYRGKYRKSDLFAGAYEAEDVFPQLGNKVLFFTATPLKDDRGNIVGAIETLQNFTARKQAEEKLRESERELSQIVEGNSIPTFVIDSEHKVTHWNKAMEELTGVVATKMVGTKEPWKVFYSEERPVMADLMVDGVAEKVVAKHYRGKYRKSDLFAGAYEAEDIFPKLGNKWLFFTAIPLRDDGRNIVGAIETLQDITERKNTEDALKVSLKEKEVLLQQIHHGVYNNLQEVSSMLKLQSRRISDGQVQTALRETQNRIESMALIHEQLYRSKVFTGVGFQKYIRTLTNNLYEAYSIEPNRIKLILDITKVPVGIDKAVPCGLIIHELVSNSLKYAFPRGRKGEIMIALHMNQENEIELTVSDNGIGLPDDLNIYKTKTMGLRLVTLQADQLKSSIRLDRTGGTKFTFTFKGGK